MNEIDRIKELSGINEASSDISVSFRYATPEDFRKGKTYIAVMHRQGVANWYQVPEGTKLKDFDMGGKYNRWLEYIGKRVKVASIIKVIE